MNDTFCRHLICVCSTHLYGPLLKLSNHLKAAMEANFPYILKLPQNATNIPMVSKNLLDYLNKTSHHKKETKKIRKIVIFALVLILIATSKTSSTIGFVRLDFPRTPNSWQETKDSHLRSSINSYGYIEIFFYNRLRTSGLPTNTLLMASTAA